MHWHNRYNVATLQRAGSVAFTSEDDAIEKTTSSGPGGSAAVIGTPDDLVKVIKDVYAQSGGFGTIVGFVHDWANPENTFRSWDLVARYVVPEINGYVTKLRESERHLQVNRAVFERAGQAIMAKIMENKDAAEALKVTEGPRFAAAGAQVPKGLGKGKQEAAE
jgi:limonene 1,2-monooxygenase